MSVLASLNHQPPSRRPQSAGLVAAAVAAVCLIAPGAAAAQGNKPGSQRVGPAITGPQRISKVSELDPQPWNWQSTLW